MSDQEKQLLQNLNVVTSAHKGTKEEHIYLEQGLKYLAERLEKLAEREAADAPKESAPAEEAPQA